MPPIKKLYEGEARSMVEIEIMAVANVSLMLLGWEEGWQAIVEDGLNALLD